MFNMADVLYEFHVIIPEPPPTLQGAATWPFQCHDPRVVSHCRVILPGEFNVMIPELCDCHTAWCCHHSPGEFNGMSSQSHVSHCKVLPLGKFTVMVPEPHATLQGPVTWRNQCHAQVLKRRVVVSV